MSPSEKCGNGGDSPNQASRAQDLRTKTTDRHREAMGGLLWMFQLEVASEVPPGGRVNDNGAARNVGTDGSPTARRRAQMGDRVAQPRASQTSTTDKPRTTQVWAPEPCPPPRRRPFLAAAAGPQSGRAEDRLAGLWQGPRLCLGPQSWDTHCPAPPSSSVGV